MKKVTWVEHVKGIAASPGCCQAKKQSLVEIIWKTTTERMTQNTTNIAEWNENEKNDVGVGQTILVSIFMIHVKMHDATVNKDGAFAFWVKSYLFIVASCVLIMMSRSSLYGTMELIG